MAFSDAFAHSRRSGSDADPELLAVCDRLAASGWRDLIPVPVREAPAGAARHRQAAAVANAFLAADQIGLVWGDPGDRERARGLAVAMLTLIEECLDELAVWIALVLERPPRRGAEAVGSKKLNARLRMLDAGAGARAGALSGWVTVVRSTRIALMQKQQAVLDFDGGRVRMQLAAGDDQLAPQNRPLDELGPEWMANLAGMLEAVFACGSARLANPRDRIAADFDWD